jgi:hypothetical protein
MKRILLLVMLTFVGSVAMTMPTAQAQEGCGHGYGGCWDGGYGWLYNTLRYEVPHFAAFPPVYYSVPVPRTYGYSPFAYPPNVRTPEVAVESQPVTIMNPYVPATKPASTPADSTTDRSADRAKQPEPLVVINPFVTQRGAIARSGN